VKKSDTQKFSRQLIAELDEIRRWKAQKESLDKERKEADEALQEAFDELEVITMERTDKLQKANEKLIDEIKERKLAEGALRESETRLRMLSSQLFKAQEQERSRLSKELHDQIGHDLVLLKSRLNSIYRKLPDNCDLLRNDLLETKDYVDEIIENVRQISTELSPSILEDLGFFVSLQWLVENFAKQHAIKASIEMEDIDHLFPQEIWINIYRVFQEVLTNISKHAKAKSISIAIKKRKTSVTFLIKDNGIGFDVNSKSGRKRNQGGLGLTAMKERINLCGGTFRLNSHEGKGTIVRFRIPLPRLKSK
jgi:signal transduction histidine kinase